MKKLEKISKYFTSIKPGYLIGILKDGEFIDFGFFDNHDFDENQNLIVTYSDILQIKTINIEKLEDVVVIKYKKLRKKDLIKLLKFLANLDHRFIDMQERLKEIINLL